MKLTTGLQQTIVTVKRTKEQATIGLCWTELFWRIWTREWGIFVEKQNSAMQLFPRRYVELSPFDHCLLVITFIPVIPTHVHSSFNSPAKAHSTPSFFTPAFSTLVIWCHVFTLAFATFSTPAFSASPLKKTEPVINWIKSIKQKWIGSVLRHKSVIRDVNETKLLGKKSTGRRRYKMLNEAGKRLLIWRDETEGRPRNCGERVLNLPQGRTLKKKKRKAITSQHLVLTRPFTLWMHYRSTVCRRLYRYHARLHTRHSDAAQERNFRRGENEDVAYIRWPERNPGRSCSICIILAMLLGRGLMG